MDGKAEGKTYRDGSVVERTPNGWVNTGERTGTKTAGEIMHPNLMLRRKWAMNKQRLLLFCRLKHKTPEDFDLHCYGCRFYLVNRRCQPATLKPATLKPATLKPATLKPATAMYRGERRDSKEIQAMLKRKAASLIVANSQTSGTTKSTMYFGVTGELWTTR